jgi:ActR/RegA family two-component response regulator
MTETGRTEPAGLLLSDDLIFTSRICGAAQAHGLEVKVARSAEALVELARKHPPRGVLVDLHNPGLEVRELLGRLAEVCPSRPRVVGYGSHVAVEVLRGAREAGCDVVLPRSRFVEDLVTELPGWLA